MLVEEGVERVEDYVKLLGDAPLLPAGDGHLLALGRIGVAQTLLQVVGFDLEGDLDLIGDSASDVGGEGSGIADGETVRGLDFDLEGLPVDLGHPLDLSESDGVAVVQAVLLLLVEADQALFLLGDAGNVDGLGLLASGIEDAMGLSEIDEGIAVESEVAGQDEASILGVDGLVQPDQIFPIVVIKYDHAFVIGGAG